MEKNSLVSVVIPTHKGAEAQTERLIESIENSTYKNVEIIVVNEGLERSKQRNLGIARSKGRYIFIPDSDWVVTPNLIQECVNLLQYYDAVYIPEQIKTKGLFARIRNWERQFYTATPIDVVRFVKREYCPFFDEAMTGPEDSDWDRRITGKRVVSLNCYYHYDDVGMFKFFSKKAYYSKSMDTFEKKNRGDKILNFKWRCFGVFFEQGKWKRFISNPVFAFLVLFMIGVRGVIYLVKR